MLEARKEDEDFDPSEFDDQRTVASDVPAKVAAGMGDFGQDVPSWLDTETRERTSRRDTAEQPTTEQRHLRRTSLPTGEHPVVDQESIVSGEVSSSAAAVESPVSDSIAPEPTGAPPRAKRGTPIASVIVVLAIGAVAILYATLGDDSASTSAAQTQAPIKTKTKTAVTPRVDADSAAVVARELAAAGERIRSGQLVGSGSALEHLLRAKEIDPDDDNVVARLETLADTFELLGDAAEASGNLKEAAAHFRAAANAQPARKRATDRLRAIEKRLQSTQPAGN